MPDMFFYYFSNQLHNLFNHLGTIGLSEYRQLQWVDMFYPIVYSVLIASLLFLAFRNSKLQWILWFPLIAALFDYFENFTLRSIVFYPVFSNGIAHTAAFFTAWKWIFISVSILFVLIGFFKWLINKA